MIAREEHLRVGSKGWKWKQAWCVYTKQGSVNKEKSGKGGVRELARHQILQGLGSDGKDIDLCFE